MSADNFDVAWGVAKGRLSEFIDRVMPSWRYGTPTAPTGNYNPYLPGHPMYEEAEAKPHPADKAGRSAEFRGKEARSETARRMPGRYGGEPIPEQFHRGKVVE